MGVETSPGEYDLTGCVMSTSKVGFEWCIQSADDMRLEIVTPLYKNAIRQGVPAPECTRRVADRGRLQEQADKAVTEKAGVVRRKLKDENLNITCRSQMRCEFVVCLFVLNVQVVYFFVLVAAV